MSDGSVGYQKADAGGGAPCIPKLSENLESLRKFGGRGLGLKLGFWVRDQVDRRQE
jgi:hypothetical protein